jgi:hypothetical protein
MKRGDEVIPATTPESVIENQQRLRHIAKKSGPTTSISATIEITHFSGAK